MRCLEIRRRLDRTRKVFEAFLDVDQFQDHLEVRLGVFCACEAWDCSRTGPYQPCQRCA